MKKAAVDFVQRFEARQGPNSRSLFAATAWDAMLIVQQASREAMKKAKPGTPEFRVALRDAIENLHDFVGSEGVYNMTREGPQRRRLAQPGDGADRERHVETPALTERTRSRVRSLPLEEARRGWGRPGARPWRPGSPSVLEVPLLVADRRKPQRVDDRYSLGMCSVLLTISVPESANSRASGCRSAPAKVQTPP